MVFQVLNRKPTSQFSGWNSTLGILSSSDQNPIHGHRFKKAKKNVFGLL